MRFFSQKCLKKRMDTAQSESIVVFPLFYPYPRGKDRLPVVAAQDDVLWTARDEVAGQAGHGGARIEFAKLVQSR